MISIGRLDTRRSLCCMALVALQSLPLLILVLLPDAARAADKPHPLEAADTSSPGATLKSFVTGMHDLYEHAGSEERYSQTPTGERWVRSRVFRCLDLSALAPAVRPSLAREAAACLKEVLDRIELPPERAWPDSEELADNPITKWILPHTDIAIVRIVDGPRKDEFLFSVEAVDRAGECYQLIKQEDYIERDWATPDFYEWFISEPGRMIPRGWLPAWSRARWCGQAVWQWVGLILTLLLSSVLMIALYLIGHRRGQALRSSAGRHLVSLLYPIIAMLIPLAARYFIAEQLQLYGNLVVMVSFALELIFLMTLMILVFQAGGRLAELIIAAPWVHPASLDVQLIRLTCRMLSIFGATVVLLEGGAQFGISLATLLAGVSVSGLALAMAAQHSLRSILGGMMVLIDKPFHVGDRIVAKGYDGVVEEIGLRSTRLRLLTGHQATIPNEEVAKAEIENIGRRPHIRRSATIELPSDTSATSIRRALEILREILKDHEGMKPEFPPRVFLRDVNTGSLGLCMIYWYHPPNYWDFLAFSERVTLEMADQFEAENIPFAAPALTVHVPEGTLS